MESERWSRVQEVFLKASELAGPERESFLQSARGPDLEMAREVRAMLAADNRNTSLLDRGLPSLAFEMVGNSTEAISSREFGPYRLIKVLGEGGMGVVWLAERSDAGNRVAIKFLPHAAFTPARRERFANEIRTLARLEHPLIARLYDAGTLADGTPWFVMEYVDGVPIDAFCRSHSLPLNARLRLFLSTCEAVQFAHTRAILHRDLKPSNILVAQDGKPRLLDFGIAKQIESESEIDQATAPNLRFLSWDYAAPEWARDGIQGLYTDVYSLGVILYQLLTGRLPFDRAKIPPGEFAAYIAARDPARPSTVAARAADFNASTVRGSKTSKSSWADLDLLCLKAMHRDPQQRYQSAEALIRDIDHYLNGQPLDARPASLGYQVSKFVKRNAGAVASTLAACVLVASLVVIFTVRLASARNRALAEAARTRRIQQFMLSLLGSSDQKAAPSDNLRVITLLDHGVQEAGYLGSDPEAQSDLYENLGNMYDMLGEYTKADNLLMLALDRRKHAPRADDARTAEILVRIGVVKADQAQDASQYKAAENYVQQGLDLASRNLPGDDPNVLSAKAALGRVIAEAGDSQRSIALLQPLVAQLSAGDRSQETFSDSLSTLIAAEYNTGNIPLADSFTSRALDLDRRLFGPTHPQFALDLVDSGLNKAAVAHYSQAEPLYRQAIDIERAWYGPDHPDLASFEALLARDLHEEGKLDESEKLLRTSLAIQEHAFGTDDYRVAVALDTLGEIEMDRGNLAGAESDLSRAVDIDRKMFGMGNYQTAILGADLGETYRREKQYNRADTLLAECVKTLKATLPPGAFNTAIAQLSWGRSLLALRRYNDAATQISEAYKVYQSQEHAPAEILQQIREDLAQSYAGSGQPAKAAALRSDGSPSSAHAPGE
jgi:eukaryotic-like serine/threonine-protein kinase